jgi:hypothetical protein
MKINLAFLATKASAFTGLAITGIGSALSLVAQYAPVVLPLLSPKAAAALGHAVTTLGTIQLFLSGSVLPKINSIAAVGSLNPPTVPPKQ